MGLKLLHPQEIEVFYILPALRKEFAKQFKDLGWKQSDIAKVMGVTEAAVSQYTNDKRASDVKFDGDVKASIKSAAAKVKEQSQFIFQTQQILDSMLKSKATCKIHHQMAGVGKDCSTCFGG